MELAERFADRAEKAADERAGLVPRKRVEADDRLRRARDLERSRLRPVREEHHQRPLREMVDDVPQEIHGGAIGPVEVFDHDQERLALHAALDQRARRQYDLALELLGLDVSGLRVFHAEHVAQHRGDGLGFLGPRAESLKTVRELLPGDVQRVGRVDPVRFAKERAEEAVRRLAQRRARPAPHDRAGQAAFGLEPGEELGDEPRLAGTGFADEADHLSPAALHAVEGGRQLVELVGAPDQRRREPERRESASGSGTASAPTSRWTTSASALPRSASSPPGSTRSGAASAREWPPRPESFRAPRRRGAAPSCSPCHR